MGDKPLSEKVRIGIPKVNLPPYVYKTDVALAVKRLLDYFEMKASRDKIKEIFGEFEDDSHGGKWCIPKSTSGSTTHKKSKDIECPSCDGKGCVRCDARCLSTDKKSYQNPCGIMNGQLLCGMGWLCHNCVNDNYDKQNSEGENK